MVQSKEAGKAQSADKKVVKPVKMNDSQINKMYNEYLETQNLIAERKHVLFFNLKLMPVKSENLVILIQEFETVYKHIRQNIDQLFNYAIQYFEN